jgi:hypothetical protein
MKKFLGAALLLLAAHYNIKAQVVTTAAHRLVYANEDSLNQSATKSKTVISGYGSAFYQRNFNLATSDVTLERAVLFVGHEFTPKISFFSELEVENAKVAGGTSGGEVSMEQAFLKFNLNPKQYIVAGLFTPRIGIINENHLPIDFYGVQRPYVESFIIPTTWRELGVGFYGTANRIPLNYSIALITALNSVDFEHGAGLSGASAEGQNASGNNLAVTASLQYSVSNFKFQVSGYMGGTVGLSKRGADSLGLNSGAFGTPLYLGEADVQYEKNGFTAKALYTYVSYPDVDNVIAAYSKNLASSMYGAYGEVGYNWLYTLHKTAQFATFARYESLNMNQTITSKAIYDGTLDQSYLTAGITYLPIPNVIIKADVTLLHTGAQNPALVINPPPNALPYRQNNQLLNIGLGYSF